MKARESAISAAGGLAFPLPPVEDNDDDPRGTATGARPWVPSEARRPASFPRVPLCLLRFLRGHARGRRGRIFSFTDS